MQESRNSKSSLAISIAVLVVLGLGYVASYPIAIRAYRDWHGRPSAVMVWQLIDGKAMPVYKPVDWLIDKTPLDKPLMLWADAWGVREVMETSAYFRRSNYLLFVCPSHPPTTTP